MKKIISLFVAIATIFTLSITASAATVTSVPGSDNRDVVVKIDSASAEALADVYSVDIDWDSLDFTYEFSKDDKNTWDPATHSYGNADYIGSNWDKTSANIKVTNHSNNGVAVAATFAENATISTKNGVTATLTNNTFNLATGVGLTYDTAANNTINVGIKGVPSVDSQFAIDTVTVTVSAN